MIFIALDARHARVLKYSNNHKSRNWSNFTEAPYVVSFLRHHIAVRIINGASEVISASGDI